jgi:hypothetical protein
LNGANLIVGVHYGNKYGMRPNDPSHVIRVNSAKAIHGQVRNLSPHALEKTARAENGGMLNLSGNDVSPGFSVGEENTFESMVIGFTAATGEHNFLRVAA